jgi:hypothetical protein
MKPRALQLILPFEPGLPDRPLILAPRLWPTMTPRARQQLAKRVAHLLRSALITADTGEVSGGLGCRVTRRNFTSGRSQVGSRTGAPV